MISIVKSTPASVLSSWYIKMVLFSQIILLITLSLSSSSYVSAEIFTAIADVEYLLETHKKIIDDLDMYIEHEEKRLETLKKKLVIYKKEHEIAMQDIPNYLGNPINSFTLIKRLTTDLDSIENTINIGTEYIKNITMNHPDLRYPTSEDLTGAAQALTRLQETYHLNISDLSEGKLNGIAYSHPMTAGDCYEIGRLLYIQKDYSNSLGWMLEALRKYKEEKNTYFFDEVDILEYIGFSYFLLDDVKSALEWTKKLLEVDPRHVRAAGNIPHYEKRIIEDAAKMKQRGDRGDVPVRPKKEETLPPHERQMYETLCRGEMTIPAEIDKRLTCRYLTENHPFLRLAPFKVEQVYIKPDIYVFHDVLSDDEIKHIKGLARPNFKRAVVHDPTTGELVPAQYRISKSAWLDDSASDTVATVTRRVAHMTGLDMTSAEQLQVVNYGIGGHYEPHFDFARKRENAFNQFPGNRIATVLFYMSEVAQGGATVFTELGLSVFPKKNAAVFWLNLHPSGEGDLATRHAACPVLRGSKWVCNKWLHQGGQELIKPCTLDYQTEGFARSPIKPISKTHR